MPAASKAASFSSAVPDDPEMMAPACPIRRPFGAVCPAMKPTTGLRDVLLHERRGVLLVGAADLADHDDGVGLGVVLEGARGSR